MEPLYEISQAEVVQERGLEEFNFLLVGKVLEEIIHYLETRVKKVKLVYSLNEAEREVNREAPLDFIIISYHPEWFDLRHFLQRFKDRRPEAQVFLIMPHLHIDKMVFSELAPFVDDYFFAPIDPERFVLTLEGIYGRVKSQEMAVIPVEPFVQELQPYLIFRSPVMKRIFATLPRIASSDQTVLISGETGTGKELVARAVHMFSPRKNGPFVAINCGAIPDSLIEAELFGHEKGAFTGAMKRRRGKFELASGGTIFLDEIGDMPVALQVKLLRVLEEGIFYRIGGEEPVKVDVRVIAATRRDLKRAIQDGLFREDLYWRLNVLRVHLPPLRERPEDIPLLALYFLHRAFNEMGLPQPYPQLSAGTVDLLEKLPWHGNVRELRNLMTRVAALLPQGLKRILPIHILSFMDEILESPLTIDIPKTQQPGVFIPVGTPLEKAEELLIKETLKYTKGNRSKAARLLNISIRTIRRKLKRFNLAGQD